MALSRRQRILEEFRCRLQAVTQENGFQTDVGLMVFLGETTTLGENDPDEVAAVVPGPEQIKWNQPLKMQIDLPIEAQAVAKAGLDEPWARVEAVLADIKRAIEIEDRTLGGLVPLGIRREAVRTLDRPEFSVTVGAAVTYLARYDEPWGAP